jgi:hypothetical protein
MTTDVHFLSAYNEVIFENFNSVLKQNLLFQTQIKFLEERVKVVPDLQGKLTDYDEIFKKNDILQHEVNVLTREIIDLKSELNSKDGVIKNLNKEDADKHRLQAALNTQAKDLGALKLESSKQKEYISQLEDMIPKKKKLIKELVIIEEKNTDIPKFESGGSF